MKILHVNTTDSGGAGLACLRIHRALLKKGVDSRMLVLNNTRFEPKVFHFNYWNNTSSAVDGLKKNIEYALYTRKQRYAPADPSFFSFPETIYDITQHPAYSDADIVQLNWTAGFLDEPSFFRKNTKPVIWRMSDLYICGGGYHYEKNFPFTTFNKYLDRNYAVRKKCLDRENLKMHLVPISNWSKSKAKESQLVNRFPADVIHNGTDLDVFKPYDKITLRKLWGLPLDKKIVLFGADTLANVRKGWGLLLEALDMLSSRDDIYLCAFGNHMSSENENIHFFGPVKDEMFLAMLYSVADLYVMPSIEEAFGQVIIESIACATPVVCFPTGGGLDVVTDENGVLAEDFTSHSLARAISKALETPFDKDILVQDIVNRFNIDDKAEEYIKLYESILGNR